MVSLITLLQTIYDELKVVLNDSTTVTTPDDHVGVLNRTHDIQTPFFGFEWQQRPVSRGTAGNREVEQLTSNTDGNVDGVDVSHDYDLIVDMGIIVDGDEIRTRDQYFGNLEDHFSPYINNPTDLHADLQRFRDEGAIPANLGDSRDVGVRKTYRIRYPRTTHEDLPPAESVDWGIDLTEDDSKVADVYPEKY